VTPEMATGKGGQHGAGECARRSLVFAWCRRAICYVASIRWLGHEENLAVERGISFWKDGSSIDRNCLIYL
jgi:hypothetical protein